MLNNSNQDPREDTRHDDRHDNRNGWLQLILVIAFIGGAVLVSYLLKAANEKPAPKEADNGPRKVVVETVSTNPQPYQINFTTNGTVSLRGLVAITPQVGGKVVWVSERFYSGGEFKADQPLFRIESADFENQISQLQAQIATQQTALQVQQAEADTAKQEWQLLYPGEDIPPLVAKTPQVQERRAALEGAKAQLKTARLNLRRATFSLPFNGRVLEANMQQGQVVNVGQQYGQAYPQDGLEIAVPLTNQQLQWVQDAPTKKAMLTVDGNTYPATIARIGGEANATTRFTTAYLKPTQAINNLLPGTFIETTLPGPRLPNAWVLPVAALQEQTTVWVVVDGKLQRSDPAVVQTTDDTVVVEDLPGIKPLPTPAQIVTSPLPEATAGTPASVRSNN